MTATATPTTVTPAPPRRTRVLRTETRLFLREPVAVAWGLVLPVGAFVVLGCVPALRTTEADLDGQSVLSTYQATVVLLAVTMLGLVSLPQIIGSYRETGALRRLYTTPMPPVRLLGSQLAIHLLVGLFGAGIVLVVGAVAWHVGPGGQTGAWLLSFGLTAAAVLSLGTLLASVLPTARAASGVGAVLFFPLIFGAGLWIPRATMPHAMRAVCDWTPLGAANRAMIATVGGSFPPAGTLLALAGYAAVLLVLAVRLFRWE